MAVLLFSCKLQRTGEIPNPPKDVRACPKLRWWTGWWSPGLYLRRPSPESESKLGGGSFSWNSWTLHALWGIYSQLLCNGIRMLWHSLFKALDCTGGVFEIIFCNVVVVAAVFNCFAVFLIYWTGKDIKSEPSRKDSFVRGKGGGVATFWLPLLRRRCFYNEGTHRHRPAITMRKYFTLITESTWFTVVHREKLDPSLCFHFILCKIRNKTITLIISGKNRNGNEIN